MPQKSQNQNIGVVTFAFSVTPSNKTQLLPDGETRASDDREATVKVECNDI